MSEGTEETSTHLQFLESLDRVNHAIQGTDDLGQAMQDVLDAVLSIFDCDRAFLLYPCDPDGATFRVPMERNKPEYPGAHELGAEISISPEVAQHSRILLEADGPVSFGPGSDYAIPASVGKQFNIKSFLSMALYSKSSKPWEFGIHQCSYDRVWSKNEKQLFEAIGHRIGDGLSLLLSYQELLEHRSFLDNIVENIPNMIFVKDAQKLRFVRFNKASEELLGYSRHEMIGKNDYDFFPKQEADFFTAKDREVINNKKRVNIPEETIETRLKGQRILHTQKIPILNEEGIPIYLLGISQDITKQKKAELRLLQSERINKIQAQIANVFLSAPDEEMFDEVLTIVRETLKSKFGLFGFIASNGDLVIPSLTGDIWSQAEVPENSAIFPPDAWGKSLWGRSIRDKKTYCSSGPFHTPDGHIHIDNFLSVPIIYGNKTIGLISVANKKQDYTKEDKLLLENITNYISPILYAKLQKDRQEKERKRAKRELKETNELLRAIIEAVPVAVIGLDLEGRVQTVWNPAAEKMLGWKAQEVMGQFLPTVPVENREEFEHFREMIRLGKTLDGVDVKRKRRDGSTIDYSIYASPLHDHKGQIIGNIAVLVDMTERQKAEESVRKLSQAIEQSPVSIIITDVEGNIEFVNAKFTQITGYTFAEIIGKNPRILKSGDTSNAEYRKLWETISSGGVWRGELHNLKKNGKLFWENATIAPVRNAENVITHYLAVKEDITERKMLEEQLRQSQKLEAVGQLAGGVAHDFNNMLGVIIGHAELALEMETMDDSLRENLTEILAAGLRSTEITRQLLAFARKQTIMPKVLDLNKTIDGTLKLLRRLIGEDVRLVWRPGEDLLPVKMDPSQIDQILANLCVNAKDAIAGVGKITMETKNVVLDDAFCEQYNEFLPGKYIMLTVSDNGCGIDQETLHKVFDPFFTTKGINKGTGLGLATVYGIVKQNDGFINVHSEVGAGTTFNIYLPGHTVKSEHESEESSSTPTPRGDETILLVEDDFKFLKMVKLMLETLGYTVLTSSKPWEALKIVNENSSNISMIITDIIMPEMTGKDLEESIKSLYPAVKCLFMSGHTADIIAHSGALEKDVKFIPKPFSRHQLAVKVREVLDAD